MIKTAKLFILMFGICNTAFAETFQYKDEFNKWWNTGVNHKNNYHPDMKKIRNKVDNAVKQADIKLLPWYNPKKYKNIFTNWQKEAYGSLYTVANDLPRLHKFVEDICNKNNISKPFIVIPPYETVINAAAGKLFSENGVIFIFPGIINNTNDEELEAIIAHEIGHIKHNHINKSLAFTLPTTISLIVSYSYLVPKCIQEFINLWERMPKEDQQKLLKASPKIVMLLSLSTYIILKKLVIGKKFEQQADKFAMDHGHANGIKSFMTKTNNQPSFADTLKYIEDNKEFLSRKDYEKLMSQWKLAEATSNSNEFWDEHPTHAERIKAAEEYLNNQNQESQGQLAIG